MRYDISQQLYLIWKYKYEKCHNPSSFEGLEIIAYSDNSDALWNTVVDDYKVIAPIEIVNTKYERVVILSNYYKGIVESIYLMSGEYAHDLNYYTDGNYVTIKEKNAQSAGIITILVISTIATIIFVSVNMSKCKMAKIAKNAADYQRVIGVNIVNDILVNTSHSSYKISSDSGGYSGGGGHFSSSGSHHSGGGHHF